MKREVDMTQSLHICRVWSYAIWILNAEKRWFFNFLQALVFPDWVFKEFWEGRYLQPSVQVLRETSRLWVQVCTSLIMKDLGTVQDSR